MPMAISKTVTAVVQIDWKGWSSSQAMMAGSGLVCIVAENIGVGDDHRSNCAGLGACPFRSGTS